MEQTVNINKENILNIRKQILKKNSNTPYYCTQNEVINIITDQDHFPYTRYYRGIVGITKPVVFEREAGFRDVNNNCYSTKTNIPPITRPVYCYQSACSTIYPCFNNESNQNDINFSKNCTTQYH
jgi:hypothetical protein